MSARLLTILMACVGLNKRWKSDFQVQLARWTSVEIQSKCNATHQKTNIDWLDTQESDVLTRVKINEAKGQRYTEPHRFWKAHFGNVTRKMNLAEQSAGRTKNRIVFEIKAYHKKQRWQHSKHMEDNALLIWDQNWKFWRISKNPNVQRTCVQ